MNYWSVPALSSQNQVSSLVKKIAPVINIVGKVPGKQDILMQSAPGIKTLKGLITDYLVREMRAATSISDIEIIQKIFGKYASKVPELSLYNFESNQRVDELLATLMIAESTNKLSGAHLIPAWQQPKQDDAMEAFTGKKSWDGFIYEHVPFDKYKSGIGVTPMPIEVKSLKIHPHKEKFSDLNDLLNKKVPKFAKHFQKEGSIGAVVVFPLSNGTKEGALHFDLKEATQTMNKYVANGVVGSLLFIDILTDEEDHVNLGIKCMFVSKNPNFAANGNIDEVKLYEMRLAKFKRP